MSQLLKHCAALLLALVSAWGHAQTDKPITIVVPTAAGGGNDAMARTVGQKLGVLLGRPVIVENRAGANGALAAEYVAKAAPDGNTLMFGYIATHAMNPALQKLRYDPVKDFEPVGLVGYSPTLMVVNPALRARDVKDLLRMLREKPDAYSVASAGNGTAPHFAAELFKMATQTAMLHVPYKGSAPAIQDLLGGQIAAVCSPVGDSFPHLKSGRLRLLATSSDKRSRFSPDVPTFGEQGYKGLEMQEWFGLFMPKGTPPAVLQRAAQAIRQAVAMPEVVDAFTRFGFEAEANTPEEFLRLMQQDYNNWAQRVKAICFKLEG